MPTAPSTTRSTHAGTTRDTIRYAVVGLGHIAQTAVLPGLGQAKHSSVTALVSDDEAKLSELSKKWGVEHTLGYDGYDKLLESDEIDAVYIALPNDMHCDFTIRALRAGKHVLVEKPMAVTVDECRRMNEAAAESKRLLMVAYRLHFDPANLRAIVDSEKIGTLRFFTSTFSMQVANDNIRNRPLAEGGGAIFDLGVYCVNAVRGLFRNEPIEVMAFAASTTDGRFEKTPEMFSVIMRFPGERLATFTASNGAALNSRYELVGTEGSICLDSAYEYTDPIQYCLQIGEKTTEKEFPVPGQFAAEIDYFSECIRAGRQPEPSGREGMADVRVIEAIIASARTKRPVAVPTGPEPERPQPENRKQYAEPREVKPFHAEAPRRDP